MTKTQKDEHAEIALEIASLIEGSIAVKNREVGYHLNRLAKRKALLLLERIESITPVAESDGGG